MTFVKQIGSGAALGAAMLLGVGLCAPPAQAGFIVTLAEVGSNVVATGSGTIDLTDLNLDRKVDSAADVIPRVGTIITGPLLAVVASLYRGYTGPTGLGSGGNTFASSGTGDLVGINAFGPDLAVPLGYVSGSALADSSTWDNQTFASLGVTPGTYVWTWGSKADADSFTLDIGAAAVPGPSGLLLLALPLGLVLLLAARPRRTMRNA